MTQKAENNEHDFLGKTVELKHCKVIFWFQQYNQISNITKSILNLKSQFVCFSSEQYLQLLSC